MKIICWNLAGRKESWELVPEQGVDFALLQEARLPPVEVRAAIDLNPGPFVTGGENSARKWRAAIANAVGFMRMPRFTG